MISSKRLSDSALPRTSTGGLYPVCAVSLTLLFGGCAHTIREIAKESSSAVVQQSVDELGKEENKRDLAAAAADPRVGQAITNVTDQITEGVLKSLESERTHQQLAALTKMATQTVAKEMLATLGSPETRQHLAELTGTVTQETMRGVTLALQQEFVPELRKTLATGFSEMAATSLRDKELHQALGATVQHVAYNAVVGANDGLRTTWLGDTGQELRGAANAGVPLLKWTFWALALIALALLSLAAIAITRTRRARTEVLRLETATLLLATAMRERKQTPETEEIVSVVRDALEKSATQHQRRGLLGILRLSHR